MAAVLALAIAACGSGPAASVPASPSGSAAASAAASLDRLQIAAIRARAYPASTLTTLRSDGDRGGYTQSVVSYQSDAFAVHALLAVPDATRPAAGWPVVIVEHGYVNPAQ